VTAQIHYMFLPVLCYTVESFATLTILMKNSLMENLGQDYVRTAYAKGLSEHRVIFVHALRNSLIPIATGLGSEIGLILAGSFLIEKVFNIDGMGYLGYTSILQRDYPVALGILVISSLLLLVGNILSDMIYVLVDPRIRFK
jgi:microcin C transport system permease protein